MEDKLIQLEYLKDKINDLPNGYISKKTIKGKIKYYLQWQNEGKKKSKYIPNEQLEEITKKIEKRRILQEEFKTLSKYISENNIDKKNRDFISNIKIEESLIKYVNEVKDLQKRDCFVQLQDYLSSKKNGKVFILYGLRRTGKTTLMRQAIYEMNELEKKKTAFIQITSKDSLATINQDLKRLEEMGFRYIFIDEVTLMSDFVEGAALFSDVFASSGMKIILSGTDSLGFILSADDQLYDRSIQLHTTFIPYREFERVLGIIGIDEYIRYGGTMSLSGINYNDNSTFSSERSTSEYVDSAIARNIQHSLKNYQYENHFRNLEDLYQHNELTNVINRVVEDINHRFTLEVLTKDFESNDLKLSAKNLRKDKQNVNDILDRIDHEEFIKRLKELLEIKNKEETKVHLEEVHKEEIKEYLILLDLIEEIEIQSIPVSNLKKYRTVFTQPGLRYSIAQAFVQSLLQNSLFQDLSILDRDSILKRCLNEIKGRMLEDLILLETKMANPKRSVFKLQFAVGEFDMVMTNNEDLTCEIYEIKYSDKIVEDQTKNLIDKDKCDKTEFRYGPIKKKTVLYRGESKNLENGIQYLNVEDYLRNL